LEAAVRGEIEAALEKAKKAAEGQDAETLRAAAEELTRSSHKLAEAVYAKASKQQQSSAQDSSTGNQGQATDGEGRKKEDVVDADFEEVKE
jgi:molecular chaperone DnaK